MSNKFKDCFIGWLGGMFSWLITALCIFYIAYFDTWPITFFFIVITIVSGLLFAQWVDRLKK
jgi:membrane protein implicated in regulation of membrane protease activity